MQKILVAMCIVFLFGGIAGFVAGRAIYNHSDGTGSDQAALEESRRIIANQREALERLGRDSLESQRIIGEQQKRIDSLIDGQSKTQELVRGAIEDNSGVIELSEDARSEIQSALGVLEKIESRK